MGASLDKNEKSFFIIDRPEWENGAIAAGAAGYAESLIYAPPIDAAFKNSNKNTWLEFLKAASIGGAYIRL